MAGRDYPCRIQAGKKRPLNRNNFCIATYRIIIVVGKNKLMKFARLETFSNVIQVPAKTPQKTDHPLKGKWNVSYFGNSFPIVLELGCGKGEYALALAGKFPDRNFIGVDIKGARMYTGARLALQSNRQNVAFLRTHIENLHYFFGPDEIDEIWLTFPDPQMKKVKKRLTSSFFLKQYTQLLKTNGIIHLKTDSGYLFEYTLALAMQNQLDIAGQTSDLYHSDLLNDLLSTKTFYEKQWLDRGIDIKYLAFLPGKKEEWTEPEDVFEKDGYRSFGRSARI